MAPDRRTDSTLAGVLAGLRRRWTDLERGWQATLVGVLVVAVAALL